MTTSLTLPKSNRAVPLSIRARGRSLKRTFRMAVPRILHSALGQVAPRIRAVSIWLEDVNGPRGGVDIRCRLEATLLPRGAVTVTSIAGNEYIATRNAAFRAGSIIDRRVKRVRTLRRQSAWT